MDVNLYSETVKSIPSANEPSRLGNLERFVTFFSAVLSFHPNGEIPSFQGHLLTLSPLACLLLPCFVHGH